MPRPTQPVALVTGASSGIGQATARHLQANGYLTYATARRVEKLHELAQAGCQTLSLDVTNEDSMRAAIKTIETNHGGVDVLVNNAGYGLNGPIEELELPDLRLEFETNVFGLVRLSQLVLPHMRQQGWGRIINIGSVGGSFTAPGAGAYHASKYAVEAISDALRCEVQGFGVDVSLLKPTGVYTAFDSKIVGTVRNTDPDSPYAVFKENHAFVTQRMFSGRNSFGIIQPEVVARTVLRAANALRPRTRYVVGVSGSLYLLMRRLLPDRAWDAMMMAQFPMQRRLNRQREQSV